MPTDASITLAAPPEQAAAHPAELSFDAIVPRRLVHREAIAEVFLTDSVPLGDDRFLVAAQLPRMHRFFNDAAAPYHDLLTELEVARQAGVLIAHRHLGIPVGQAFIFHTVDMRVEDLAASRLTDGPPSRLVLEVQIGDRQERDGVPYGFSLDIDFIVDGLKAAHAGGTLLFLAKPDYLGLRRHVREGKGLSAFPGSAAPVPVPTDPASVSRRDARNVVVSPVCGDPMSDAGLSCKVVVDQRHPCLFDHPLDHLPGMLMLEAYRQAAVAAACRTHGLDPDHVVVTRCAASFTEFGELEFETGCEAHVGAPVAREDGTLTVPVKLALSQDGKRLGKARVEVTACR